jgi:uncharacterized protein (DUF2126 family)/transglutaminase-like putative cysteine protease
MAIRVGINHKTEYRFDRLVTLSPHIIRLRPAAHSRTPVHAYSLKILPEKHFINWQQDPFGNYQARLVFPEKTRGLSIEVDMVAEMVSINPFDFFLEEYAKEIPFVYEEQLARELVPYREVREDGPRLRAWLDEIDLTPRSTNDFLVDLNRRLHQTIAYNVRMEPGIQTCEETLDIGVGSCRDTGWLLVQILRHLGLAARFVSGYLVQLSADQKSLDGPSGPEHDFTDLHAWAEVYVPGAGWIGLDPTSGLFAGEGHIPLACTPDPVSAAPVTGSTGKAEVDFYFHNQVTRIHEDPRVTRPYSDQQWARITEVGHQVDRRMRDADVRLTMGGEPTFVSIDDMDGAQWNIAALGAEKRELAGNLLQRLYTRFASGGALHYGQGKWYPGEMLPRWALSCLWRADGVPVWHDPRWMADERRDHGYGAEQALRFMQVLRRYLGVEEGTIEPGHEDAYYYLWKEGRLPANVDVLDSRLEDPLQRARLRRLFQRGLDKVTGYAMPLKWRSDGNDSGGWLTARWSFRSGHMFLLPGDSPMGYRLPLESLPWVDKKKLDVEPERSTFEQRAELGDIYGEVFRRYREVVGEAAPPTGFHEQSSADVGNGDQRIHSAICVEPRDGCLYIFLPPLTHLEHYLDLVTSIEATAAELQMPVVMEGYEPPHDHRLLRLAVTPDPGVIEVNIHPAADWDQLHDNTVALYEEARLARLGTEKFMLDGRHTGTGGGNHVTIGGATPADSPILRRPDLLRSLVAYWQNHPGLSYLFSGLFVGPTSQAPRVDEARDDSLYELEIAFQQMPQGQVAAPWLVDRLMRNLLIDVTGNTHRAEFCIDKLYSPDSASGRLGLVEFRAFEMPPHARMSLVQMLLLRSLIAWFWDQPYRRAPVRWGTELHDRFMLPHFVQRDCEDVVTDLQQAGFPLQKDWLAPFLEFRFPHCGRVVRRDIELELRTGIEPWHVLGEEVTSQGTARFVDSSVERLQVRVNGMTDGRHVVGCNGRQVPLRPTGRRGEFVAGVRYKAWQPPSGLHPTIAAHAPLVFDIIDTWNQRSIGGCTYHVVHPGGRHFETFPINANEAESRRIARFRDHGHTPGVLNVTYEPVSPDHPYTLDLRWRETAPGGGV